MDRFRKYEGLDEGQEEMSHSQVSDLGNREDRGSFSWDRDLEEKQVLNLSLRSPWDMQVDVSIS